MKPKFKAGDRVIVVDARDTLLLEVGMTGTVVDYDQTIFEGWPIATILFDNSELRKDFPNGGSYHDYRFELIEKTEINA